MHFLWLHIYTGKYREFLELIKNPTQKTLVFTPNPEILLRASQDAEFLEILRQADFLTPDANGLYTATLMQEGSGFLMAGFRTFFSKKSLAERYGELIQWSNLTRDLVDATIRENKKILMIDNYLITKPKNDFEVRKMEVQKKLRELFALRFPELQIEIVFDGDKNPEELANFIQKEDISYVFSCIGMKKQEQRLIEIFSYLSFEQKVVGLGVGSSFDYLLGLQKRAPLIFQKLWLEWFYRLMLNPRARWSRIVDAFWRFPRSATR